MPDDNIFDRLTALRNPSTVSEPLPDDADGGAGVDGASHEEPPMAAAVAQSSFQSAHDGGAHADVAPSAGTSSSWAQRVMAEARASGLTSGREEFPLASGFNSGWVAMDQDMAQGSSSSGGVLSVKRSRCEEEMIEAMEPNLEPPPVRSSTLDGLPPSASSSVPSHAPAAVEGVAAPGSGSRLKKAGTAAAASRCSSDGGGGGGSEGGRRVRFEGLADDEGKELEGGRDGQGQRGGRGSSRAGHGRWGICRGGELSLVFAYTPGLIHSD